MAQISYRYLIKFTWFVYCSDSSLSTLPSTHCFPDTLLIFVFCFWTYMRYFSFSEYLNILFFLFKVLFLQMVPWLLTFWTLGNQFKYCLLESLSPTILAKEASMLKLNYNTLCRNKIIVQKIFTIYSSSTEGVYFLSPMLLSLARWILVTNVVIWIWADISRQTWNVFAHSGILALPVRAMKITFSE